MPGILADKNIEGQCSLLVHLLREEPRCEFWESLEFSTPTFADLGLDRTSTDWVVWQTCQRERLVLITDNRNAKEEDSLEEAIRALNSPECLPVITISNVQRFMHDREYAERVADQVLDYLLDLENLQGTGRLYVP